MFEITGIKNTDIRITRGDTATLGVELFDNEGEYHLKNGDVLELTAKENVNDVNALIHIIADENAVFHFTPDDTKNIEFGSYPYDIQLTLNNGDVYTVIPLSHIIICEEVTI